MTVPSIEGVERTDVPSGGCPVSLRATCGREAAGLLVGIGADDRIDVRMDAPPAPGERLVVTLPGGLRLVGTCVARGANESRIGLHASLGAFHRDAGNVRPLRTDGPRGLSGALVTLRGADGRTARCGVRDVSLTGLFVWCRLDLAVGEPVTVGAASAFVARAGEGGYGLTMAAGQLGEDVFARAAGSAVAFGT